MTDATTVETTRAADVEFALTLASPMADRWVNVVRRNDRAFRAALVCAALLHGALLIGVLGVDRLGQRVIGDEAGSNEAIAVSFVTEADFLAQTTATDPSSPPPGNPAQAPSPPQPQAEPPPPQPQPEPEAQSEQPQAQAEPAPPPPEPAPDQKPEQPTAAAPTETAAVTPPPVVDAEQAKPEPVAAIADALPAELEKNLPSLLSLDAPVRQAPEADKAQSRQIEAAKTEAAKAEPTKAKPAPAAKPKPVAKTPPQKTAKLDLSTPPPSFNAPIGGGGQASFSRPPGITRSGFNDKFARDVVRALQQTMPQLRETRGRVTVRILLTDNGNVRDVQVVAPSPLAELNQSVVFAARQTSYPLPPGGSNEADRTFLITYIYN